MHNADRQEFGTRLKGLGTIYGREVTGSVFEFFWRALETHDANAVFAAMDRHVRRSKFFPTPAELLESIDAGNPDGRPGSEQAWAQCARLLDESESVVITAEMREAWQLAWPAIDARHNGRYDTVAGRKAFLEAYTAIVARAKAAGSPVAWELQPGSHKGRKAEVVTEAIQQGRLPASFAAVHLAQVPAQGGGLALLEYEMKRAKRDDGDQVREMERALANLRGLRAGLDGKSPQESAARRAAREKREQFNAVKQEAVGRVLEWLGVDDLPPATLPDVQLDAAA